MPLESVTCSALPTFNLMCPCALLTGAHANVGANTFPANGLNGIFNNIQKEKRRGKEREKGKQREREKDREKERERLSK